MGRGTFRNIQTFFQRRHTGGQEIHEKVLIITNHEGNATQHHDEIINSYLIEWLLSKRQEITSVGEDAEKREPCVLLVGMQFGAATVENSIKVPQKIKNRITTWHSNSTSAYLSKGKNH